MKALLFVLPLAILAACGTPGPDGDAASTGNFVPPVTQAPEPMAGQRQSTPLTAYVGHHPRDAVGGVSFFDRTEVANLLVETVPDERVRRLVVGRDATTVPIFRQGSRIAAHGCEAHDCGDHHWTVLVAIDGNRDNGAVCHHDAASMGAASDWSTRGLTTRRPGACPSA